jgi:hypothetical protein
MPSYDDEDIAPATKPAPKALPPPPKNPVGGGAPRGGAAGGGIKKQETAPPPPPAPAAPPNQEQLLRDREVLDARRRIEDVKRQQLTEALGGDATKRSTGPSMMEFGSYMNKQVFGPSAKLARAGLEAAGGAPFADRVVYRVQEALPDMLGLGPPKGAARENLTGTFEGEVVAYPRGAAPTSEDLGSPRSYLERVRDLRELLREAEGDRERARQGVLAAQREPTAQSPAPQIARYQERLQRVVNLRDSLRKMGYTDEEISKMK